MAQFHINDYDEHEAYCMHCVTSEEAECFLDYLDAIGKRLLSGKRYSDLSIRAQLLQYGANTCYFFNENTYGTVSLAYADGYNVLEFSDFDWPGFEEVPTDQDESCNLNEFLAQFKLAQEVCHA